MASLLDLQRALFPSARLIGARRLGTDQGARRVTWVRVVRDARPAVESIDPGDLVIVPSDAPVMVDPEPPVAADLATTLGRAQVSAVVLLEVPAHRDAVDAVGSAMSAAGVPTLAVGGTEATALERSIIGFLVNRQAELERRAAELEASLARLALHDRGLDVQAAAIGTFLGRAVVIEGRTGDALAIHAPADVPSAAAAVAAYLARAPAGVALRVGIAGPAGDPGPGGRLLILGDAPASELERIAAERVAGLLGVELARAATTRRAREDLQRGDPLPEDGPPWVVLLASQGRADGPDDLAARDATRADLRLLFSPRRFALRGSAESLEVRAVAAAVGDDDRRGLATAAKLAAFLGRPVAVSRPFDEPGARPVAEAAARATLDAAAVLPEPPAVATADLLPAYQLLGGLRTLPDGLRVARELLDPILVGRPDVQRERLETLRAILGSASIGEAATRLGVHRNTVAYRMARLEQLAGWDLADPELRLALQLATRLVQSAQS